MTLLMKNENESLNKKENNKKSIDELDLDELIEMQQKIMEKQDKLLKNRDLNKIFAKIEKKQMKQLNTNCMRLKMKTTRSMMKLQLKKNMI